MHDPVIAKTYVVHPGTGTIINVKECYILDERDLTADEWYDFIMNDVLPAEDDMPRLAPMVEYYMGGSKSPFTDNNR